MFWIFALGNLLVADGFSAIGPLSVEENQELQKTCGLVPEVFNNSTATHKGYLSEDVTTMIAPWSVAVMLEGMAQHCSGSLISPRHVLTAAHCVTDNYTAIDVDQFYFVIDDDCGTTRGVCKLNETYSGKATKVFLPRDYAHPMRFTYAVTQYADIAVFELAEAVNLTDTTLPACLADFKAKVGTQLDQYGYGYRVTRNDMGSLQHVRTIVTTCDDFGSKFTTDLDHMCTFSASHPCDADSGSGFISDVSGKKTIVGLVSNGPPCEDYVMYPNHRELMDHNTAIAPHTKWICEKTGICLENSENQGEFYTGDVLTIYNNEIY